MRKAFAIAVLIGIVALIAYHLSRPKPLRPIAVTWQEVGRVITVVDLDADGNDELLVLDKRRRLWWVQFRLPKPIRQKIPVPKDAEWFTKFKFRGQMMVLFVHTKTYRAFLTTRQGGKWFLKDLGKVASVKVTDADHDGQVNDAIMVLKNGKRTVFSRMKDGTIVERPDLPSWQADLDGDGKNDAVYVKKELRVHFSSGHKASLKLPPSIFIAIVDMDSDKMAEIVGVKGVITDRCFYCWHYKNGEWHKSSTLKFREMNWIVLGGDIGFSDVFSSGFLPEQAAVLFRDEKGAYLVTVTEKGPRVKVWEVRWRKGKWTKRLMGEIPQLNTMWVRIVRVGQEWLVFGGASAPFWQWLLWLLWEKVEPLQPLRLNPPESCFFVYGWDGQRRWTLLGRWRGWKNYQLADMDGDGRQELTLVFPKRLLVVKFENGQWRTGWMEVPFAEYEPIGDSYGFRYGGREWAIYQDRDSHRCIAITLEGDGQQSKRHQPQRRD
jgi:hypothetical protein